MINPIRNHSQSQCFNFGDGIFSRFTIRQDTGEIGNFGNPTTIIFFLDIYLHFNLL